MAKTKYFFQRKKRSFAQKFFDKGLNGSSYVLFGIKEIGKDFLRGLPNSYPALESMKEIFGGDFKMEIKESTVKNSISRLIKQGLVDRESKEKTYCLTEKGEKIVLYIKNSYSILKKSWDGKLRLVVFDIPEEYRYWRSIIRQELSLFQFHQLQKSVYIGKHPLSESFYREIEEGGMDKYIFILTIDKIDRKDEILKSLELE